MQVTRALEYANRAVILLAEYHGKDPLLVSRIAKAIAAPPNFLHHVLNTLARGGVVSCLRGSKRGYQLARPPSEISLLDIFELVEGPLAITSCTADSDWCDRESGCSLAGVWRDVQDSMETRLRKATLDGLSSPHWSAEGCAKPVD
jgi:Rrf2 family protein